MGELPVRVVTQQEIDKRVAQRPDQAGAVAEGVGVEDLAAVLAALEVAPLRSDETAEGK